MSLFLYFFLENAGGAILDNAPPSLYQNIQTYGVIPLLLAAIIYLVKENRSLKKELRTQINEYTSTLKSNAEEVKSLLQNTINSINNLTK